MERSERERPRPTRNEDEEERCEDPLGEELSYVVHKMGRELEQLESMGVHDGALHASILERRRLHNERRWTLWEASDENEEDD